MLRKNHIVILLLTLWSCSAFALIQNEKLWLGIGTIQNITPDGKWRYLLFSQSRLINESEPIQSLLLEGGIGNVLNEYITLWAGYRFTERNPYDGYNPENRFFEQIVSRFMLSNSNQLNYRARLEQVQIRNASDISLRLRHRLSFSHNESLFLNLEPFVYDEVFTQLNRSSFTPNNFIFENRIFLGFNYRINKGQWIELGYMNQFQMHQRNQTENIMSHVIIVTYNL